MHIRLIAVGDRQPSWVDAAFEAYPARLPREWRFRIEEIPLPYRARARGRSKISGSLQGAARAGVRILQAVGRYARPPR